MFSICSLSFGYIAQWCYKNRLLVCLIYFSVWPTRFSFHRLLQVIKATDNFPDREEVGFLLRSYSPSAGLLGAVFVFLPGRCFTNYKGKGFFTRSLSYIYFPTKRKYHIWKAQQVLKKEVITLFYCKRSD